MNQYFPDLPSDLKLSSKMITDGMAYYQSRLANQALDLSRRRYSIETPCKTPSSYSGSSFGERSPSTSHDSPTTSASSSSSHRKILGLSDTPLRHYPSPNGSMNHYGSGSPTEHHRSFEHSINNGHHMEYEMREVKQEVMSPKSYRREEEIPSPTSVSQASHMTPFMMNAAAFQKQLAQIQSVTEDTPVTPTTPNFIPIPSPQSLDPMLMSRDGKRARPFKAYPREPLSISSTFTASDSINEEKFQAFRNRMLQQICLANGGSQTISNPKMRRTTRTHQSNDFSVSPSAAPVTDSASAEQMNHEQRLYDDAMNAQEANDSNNNNSDTGSAKDSAYFERRKKNNAAAKKSRDRRREKEDEIAIRAAYFERETIQLTWQLAAAHKQLAAAHKQIAAAQKELALHGITTPMVTE